VGVLNVKSGDEALNLYYEDWGSGEPVVAKDFLEFINSR